MTTIKPGAMFDVALQAASQGWAVFPLAAGGKLPAIAAAHPAGDPLQGRCRGERGRSGHGCHDATTDPDRIRRWPGWRTGRDNVGIATGPSRLLVIDLDVPAVDEPVPPAWQGLGVVDGADAFAYVCERAGQPAPWATRTVHTPSGGTHLYFVRPRPAPDAPDLGCTAGERGQGLGWHIDTRGAGGYVVGPGSVVNGTTYDLASDIPPTPLPEWIADALTPLAPSPPPMRSTELLAGVRHRSKYAETALHAAVDRVLKARPGERNHTLYAAAASLGELIAAELIPEPLATEALRRAALVVGPNATKIDKTIARGIDHTRLGGTGGAP